MGVIYSELDDPVENISLSAMSHFAVVIAILELRIFVAEETGNKFQSSSLSNEIST